MTRAEERLMRIAACLAVWLSSTQISMGRMGFPYTKNSCDGAVASTLRCAERRSARFSAHMLN